jgi:hypothetical protein
MWDRTAEPSPTDAARRRNPGPQILRSHALGRGTVFCVIEPGVPPSWSMQQGLLVRQPRWILATMRLRQSLPTSPPGMRRCHPKGPVHTCTNATQGTIVVNGQQFYRYPLARISRLYRPRVPLPLQAPPRFAH